MNYSRLQSRGNQNVFKGSQLVTCILERNSGHIQSRAAALTFCRQLFQESVIKGVFGADSFEDSVQLYAWQEHSDSNMTSNQVNKSPQQYVLSSADVALKKRDLCKQTESIKLIESSKYAVSNGSTTYSHEIDTNFQNVRQSVQANDHRLEHVNHQNMTGYQTSWNLQRFSYASSESSVDLSSHSYGQHKEQKSVKALFTNPAMTTSHEPHAIQEEAQKEPVMEITGTSPEYSGSSSITGGVAADLSNINDSDAVIPQRFWQQDYQNSYSDNEKQLIEQMNRMKRDHANILRTYEDRITKLMAKMHELRNIAETLENCSTKSSLYGEVVNKSSMLNFLSSKTDNDNKSVSALIGSDADKPPILPPRPGRGCKLNPNKPQIQTDVKMKPLQWTRILLKDESEHTTIWHTMMEPKIDAEEIERLFSCPLTSPTDSATLYDDLVIRRGRSRQQLVSIYDTERSKRIVICMKCIRATLNEVVSTVSSLDTSQINHESLVELLELLSPVSDLDKILYHVQKEGAGHLDHPEYLVFELSKVDHFKDRLEFIRFQFKLIWHLFEIDQQLWALHNACDEISNSTSLKNLLETLLAIGNYLNSAAEMGQADGFALNVLNKLTKMQDRDGKGTLLEFVLKTYCQVYENENDLGCPTKFRLPEPSNMRHAAQVSFEGIHDALSNLHSDLQHVREQLLDPKHMDSIRPMDSFRVSAENCFAAVLEAIGEQEKVLQNTIDLFNKTLAYYRIEKQSVSPQQFFSMWAVFLHDCKFFWKLTHRRLAKEKFEQGFKFKSQMSACLLDACGTFKGGLGDIAIHFDASNRTDSNTSTQQPKSNASTKQRISNRSYTERHEQSTPNIPPKPSHTINEVKKHTSERSSSPKQLTSSPPISCDVLKPLPKTPILNGHLPHNSAYIHPPNYENQSEFEKYQHNPYISNFSRREIASEKDIQTKSDHHSTISENMQSIKSSQQFSLKTWLKREREQVRKCVETESVETKTKLHASKKTFKKFKNTLMQKFSGTSNKKPESPSQKTKDSKNSKNSRSENSHLIQAENDQTSVAAIANTYTVDYSSLQQKDTSPAIDDIQVHIIDSHYNSPIPEAVVSSLEDPDNEESCRPHTSHYNCDSNNESASSTKINARYDSEIDERGEINNNDRLGNKVTVDIVFPMADSKHTDIEGNEQLISEHTHDKYMQNFMQSSTAFVSNLIAGQAAPLYKSRFPNNYENHAKFDNTDGIKQWAEPVKPQPASFQQSGILAHSSSYQRETGYHASNKYGYDSNRNKERKDISPLTHTCHQLNNNISYSEDSQIACSFNDTPRTITTLNCASDFTSGNRQLITPQPIGSLIEKFNKYNNNSNTIGVSSNIKAIPLSKQTMITSTPSALGKSLTSETNNQTSLIPHRTSFSPSKSNTVCILPDDRMCNSNYKWQENLPNNSALSRLDNLTSTHVFSPSNISYTTPGHKPYSPTNKTDNYCDNNTPTAENLDRSREIHATPTVDDLCVNTFGNRDSRNMFNVNDNQINDDQSDDRDDVYRAELRKAANSNHCSHERNSKSRKQYTVCPNFGTPYSRSILVPHGSEFTMRSATHNNEEVSYMAI